MTSRLCLGPRSLCHIPEPGGHENEGGVSVGEGVDHARAFADLAVELLNSVVGAYASSVLYWRSRVGRGLCISVTDDLDRHLLKEKTHCFRHL